MVDGAGTITNDGKIYAATVGVSNTDTTTADVATLYNYGTISGSGGGVYDTGGHSAVIYNYGAINGGPTGYAIYTDTSTAETLFNSGDISGTILLGAANSTVVNTGVINGLTELLAADSVTNSGTMGFVYFGDTAAGGTFVNSGTLTESLWSYDAGFDAVNSGTIEGDAFLLRRRFVVDRQRNHPAGDRLHRRRNRHDRHSHRQRRRRRRRQS